MSSEKIKKEMQIFEASVRKLSSGVAQTASLWADLKFSELSSSVSEVAVQSRDVMTSGDRSCNSIDKFEKIASEKY